ncbi:MAG: NYN domain-containing protein [Dehalococcoidia bacterium]|nr:NYN domain-containing protein [Dehalococcoidia bacterium]
MDTKNRVAIFIDGSNLYHSLEENCGRADLDFHAFVQKLVGPRQLFRTYYYNILQDAERKPQAAQEQQKFLASMYNIPRLEVRLGTFKYRGDQMVEKGVDIMLATDLLQFAWRDLYDAAVLVSGDGDFSYAVQAVKNMGKYVEVAAFAPNLSWDLAQIADDRHYLDQEYFKLLWVSGRKSIQTTAAQIIQPSSAAGAAARRRRRPRRRGGSGPGGAAPSEGSGSGEPS